MPMRLGMRIAWIIGLSDTQVKRNSASSSQNQSDDISAKSLIRASLARSASAVSRSRALSLRLAAELSADDTEQHGEASRSAETTDGNHCRLITPFRQRHRLLHRDVDDQWPVMQWMHRYDGAYGAEKARRSVGSTLCCGKAVPRRDRRHPVADLVRRIGIARKHQAIATQQCHSLAGWQFDRAIESR